MRGDQNRYIKECEEPSLEIVRLGWVYTCYYLHSQSAQICSNRLWPCFSDSNLEPCQIWSTVFNCERGTFTSKTSSSWGKIEV